MIQQEPPLPPGLSFTPPAGEPPLPPGLSFTPPQQTQHQSAPVQPQPLPARRQATQAQPARAQRPARPAPAHAAPAPDLGWDDGIPVNPALSAGAITGDNFGMAPAEAPGSSEASAIDLARTDRDTQMLLKQGAWVRNGNEVWQLPGDAYTGDPRGTEQVVPGVHIARPGAERTAEAAYTAFSEQIPSVDEAQAFLTGALSGRGYGAIRDEQMLNRDLLNQTDRGARVGGGIAGALAGVAAPGGAWVQGGRALNAAGRAAALGAGYGGAYGFGNTDGGLGDRMTGAGVGAGAGALAGFGASALSNALSRSGARAIAEPTPARRLADAGVELTLGQMLENVPVAGPMIRGAEDAISGVPFVGSAVAGARNQGIESFNRVAINRALSPIRQSLPDNLPGGYDAIRYAQERLGQAYDDVLPHVSAQLDQPLYDELAGVLDRAATEMPEPMLQQLGRVLQSRVFRDVDEASATLSGEQFKRIESELGALARQYRTASDPAAIAFGQAVGDVRQALRNMVARQNPFEAPTIQRINEGYANLTRVERAAGSTASQATDGMFTPTQLGVAVNQSGGSRSQAGRGDNLMQDLASAGRAVLPNRIGDSGTASRGAMTALLGGAATGTVSPMLALPVGAALATYSRPVQAVLNQAYRAYNPGSGRRVAGGLFGRAAEAPALDAAVLQWLLNHSRDDQVLLPAR